MRSGKLIFLCVLIFSKLFGVLGQRSGFGAQPPSPFGGGNIFVPQNFPRPVDQTIDLEQAGSFTLSPPDGSAGVQLLETTVRDGNRIILQEGGQQNEQGGQGQNFGQQGFLPNLQGGGQQGFQPNLQGQQTFITRPAGVFNNQNQQVRIVQAGGGFGNPFPGIQLPVATLMAPIPNTNPFLGPPNSPSGRLVNNIIAGIPGNPLPTAIPSNQVNIGQRLPMGNIQGNLPMSGNQFQMQGNQGLQGNQFQQIQGNQFQQNLGNQFQQDQENQFQQIQGNQQFQRALPTGIPNTQDAVNSITGSNTFDERFNLIDPTTNNAVQDVSNPGAQNHQGQFQANQNLQQPSQNSIFPQQNQFQNQGQVTGNINNQFRGGLPNVGFQAPGQNSQFNRFDPPPPQFIGNQRQFNNVPRSEFANNNDIRSANTRAILQANDLNVTLTHPMDPSVGLFLTDVLLNNLPQRANTIFRDFGQQGFTDIFPGQPQPTSIPDIMNTLAPGLTVSTRFTTMPPPSTTTVAEYSCQHSKCGKGQACVYDEKYRCPKWIPLLQCKCLAGCMYNDWFIRKNFVIPVDRCGNHCACERDDGVATCTKIKCPNAA
ncbi:unnamed protein product [Mytilus coruscus]|uniref:Uncharacterized protein n=1 Tax=Mytilus coruscus TaxID=42192 RepID=A0A6J8C8S3_MYTCO|nr:unnamed protein product [Mytilus coruscus]